MDQRDTPHCVGFAWAAWLAASPVRQRPIGGDGIYRLAQHFDEWQGVDYDGTSVRGGAKALALSGHITEYRWAFDVDSVVNHILRSGPVVLGTNWYRGMNDAGDMQPTGSLLGGHAYLAYRANVKTNQIGIRNSWGADFGTNGNGVMSLDTLERLLAENGEACTALENKSC